ncbi:N-acetylglucosamine-6-sulfatase [Eumeta japonica]|uniref:N-acetylglucosamine-6-sulfatase n=1 Tax=Eumeta variegata TaxID=151549 RepID=A0A4C1VUW2_EUMVA|nr:N-acetylglucosamine-6-sulfatase [Eumeta japonica]
MYPHNHGTRNNSIPGGCNGDAWKLHETNTFATKLKEDGYKTFYAGKYLNQYGVNAAGGPEVVPPGWTEWHGLVGNSVYYDYVLSNNGVPTHSDTLYLTDVISDLAVSFIETQTRNEPFLLVVSPPAPHAPFTPAPRHIGNYANVMAKRTPNFNIDTEDKHWLLRMPPIPLPTSMLTELDRAYRSRWEALLAVDEMVSAVFNALTNRELLNNTYVFYTSDNGYHIGQFSQVYDKRQPYETDIKIPLIVSGPGIEHNTTSSDPVMNIDLAPTILSLAGVQIPDSMDGKPIELFNKKDQVAKERFMLIEYYGERSPKTVDENCPWKYDKNLSHFEEMYDLNRDPYEMDNIIHEVFPALKHWYRLNVASMLECVGSQQCSDHLQLL